MEYLVKESIRYLGYGNHAVDTRTLAMIEDSLEELQSVAACRSTYRIFSFRYTSADVIKIENLQIKSKNLAKNLRGCESIVLFGATLGVETDRLIHRLSVTDMAKAVVMQACAAAYLEEYCDRCQAEIAQRLEGERRYLRPRFSPGYGDFSIGHQRDLLRMMEAPKTIGLTMTESYMMTPTKSVTALMGISAVDEFCHRGGCECCEKTDCSYRR